MAARAPRLLLALWLPWLLLLLSTKSVVSTKIPRLGVHGGLNARNPGSNQALAAAEEFQTFYYHQTLDHFNYRPESYKTFRQRYIMSFKHWRGANASAPILAYLGEESSLDADIGSIGFLTENAARFGALLVYIEVGGWLI